MCFAKERLSNEGCHHSAKSEGEVKELENGSTLLFPHGDYPTVATGLQKANAGADNEGDRVTGDQIAQNWSE